jgi:hypothetical protein
MTWKSNLGQVDGTLLTLREQVINHGFNRACIHVSKHKGMLQYRSHTDTHAAEEYEMPWEVVSRPCSLHIELK